MVFLFLLKHSNSLAAGFAAFTSIGGTTGTEQRVPAAVSPLSAPVSVEPSAHTAVPGAPVAKPAPAPVAAPIAAAPAPVRKKKGGGRFGARKVAPAAGASSFAEKMKQAESDQATQSAAAAATVAANPDVVAMRGAGGWGAGSDAPAPSGGMLLSDAFNGGGQPARTAAAPASAERFSGSRGISSDQFFNRDQADQRDAQARIQQYSGAQSLSSDQYFGRDPPQSSFGGRGGGTTIGTEIGNIVDSIRASDVTEKVGNFLNKARSALGDN